MREPAIVALTPRGGDLGRRLATALGQGEVILAESGVRPILAAAFQAGRPLVCVMALGIVVRVLGPLTQDKTAEPPVVVLDESGRFVISVLGGHEAGANALAQRLAEALGAVAVITTASDALNLPAVDLIGKRYGWKIEGDSDLTAVAAAVVRGEAIAVYQDAGTRDWCAEFGDWPATFHRVEACPETGWAGVLLISDRLMPRPACPTVVYRPPTLVLGVGCRRGALAEDMEAFFAKVWQEHEVAPLSLRCVATASLKADEVGLLQFTRNHAVPMQTYNLEELDAVGDLPTPSAIVRAKIGVAGVAEAAAMLAADTTSLLMRKQRYHWITMALARKDSA